VGRSEAHDLKWSFGSGWPEISLITKNGTLGRRSRIFLR
jgi:hypothetical protein